MFSRFAAIAFSIISSAHLMNIFKLFFCVATFVFLYIVYICISQLFASFLFLQLCLSAFKELCDHYNFYKIAVEGEKL